MQGLVFTDHHLEGKALEPFLLVLFYRDATESSVIRG